VVKYHSVIFMKKQMQGSLALVLATVIWGSAFVAQSVGMDLVGPFTFQAVRCALAVVGLLPVIAIADRNGRKSFISQWRDRRLWTAGILCAIPLFLAVNLQQIGIVYTSAGKSAFLTAMYIVLVPVLGLFLKRRPSPMILVSVILAVVGLYLLSCVGVTQVNIGDIYLMGCALMFAIQILVVDHYAPTVDALRLNCLQAAFCSVGSWVLVLINEEVSLPAVLDCWLPLSYAGFLSMGAAYALQIIGQKNLAPAPASLIMSLESVFAVLFGWLILNETMTTEEYIGCILMFCAVILSQINFKPRTKNRGR